MSWFVASKAHKIQAMSVPAARNQNLVATVLCLFLLRLSLEILHLYIQCSQTSHKNSNIFTLSTCLCRLRPRISTSFLVYFLHSNELQKAAYLLLWKGSKLPSKPSCSFVSTPTSKRTYGTGTFCAAEVISKIKNSSHFARMSVFLCLWISSISSWILCTQKICQILYVCGCSERSQKIGCLYMFVSALTLNNRIDTTYFVLSNQEWRRYMSAFGGGEQTPALKSHDPRPLQYAYMVISLACL